MGDIQTRPFSKNYSGLINQSVIAAGITLLCVTGQELMKRKRRGKHADGPGLGSRESWEFGYLYQGRSWARNPSPASPRGWPLSWVPQAIGFSEDKMNELRGMDATIYVRFLRGCCWFVLLQSLSTFLILFPIHVAFSENSVSPKSMTRASIASLVLTSRGLSLLWIHICLLFWITLTWIATLFWICYGAFKLRADSIQAAAKLLASGHREQSSTKYYPHPHPQYGFAEVLPLYGDKHTAGLRLRTIMVSNVPHQLRDEKELKEYFEYYMARKLGRPAIGLNTTTQPGFINKSVAFLFNRAKRLPTHLPPLPLPTNLLSSNGGKGSASSEGQANGPDADNVPVIDRVVVCRKMTELAHLLERREEMLRLLETAHIKLAQKALLAVKRAMDLKAAHKPFASPVSHSRANMMAKQRKTFVDTELGDCTQEGTISEEARMEQLIEVLGPYVEEFGLNTLTAPLRLRESLSSTHAFRKLRTEGSDDSNHSPGPELASGYPPTSPIDRPQDEKMVNETTIWEALLSLPRNSLDAYQPLVNLSHLFRGKVVPSIDYYTAKLNLLTSLVTENRAKSVNQYDPVSTAFVTFADPGDARRACKYLAVHPNNPLACEISMAPMYQDLDWIRVMKSSFNGEFVKDWVVSMGVWAFTIFWIFPVSLLVGLVSIQNISVFLPALKTYLDKHPWEEELIQSFLPTLLVALLALLIPLILLLIAKKAHTITTLSALHDRIMTRYYKFLIVNVLVFFCVGTAALQTLLESFRPTTDQPRVDVLKIVADSFPTAGPFYVGWLIFTTAMNGGFEIVMLGLPLIMYPSTRRQVTPRKRAVGTRPRTFNFYYWLPTHMLVVHVLLLFSVLNPFVLPFGAIYFFVETGVVKNQLIHVYAKNYEANGQLILIRVLRYSLDGLILTQAVFLAYMVVLKKSVNVGLAAFLIVFTTFVKIFMTRMCRAQFERDDILEAQVLCGQAAAPEAPGSGENSDDMLSDAHEHDMNASLIDVSRPHGSRWGMPAWVTFSYSTIRRRPLKRPPMPFRSEGRSFSRMAPFPPITPPIGASTDTTRADYHPSAINYRWPDAHPDPPVIDPLSEVRETAKDDSGPVVPHPPPITWDDQTTDDLPYDNPFYTRAINNVLWLPRNPCGLLDLDDTVDLRTSITVDLSVAPLGTWTGIRETSSPLEMSQVSQNTLQTPSASSLLEQPGSPQTTPQQMSDVDGTEDIDLPPAIRKRLQSQDEEDVEQAAPPLRPSTIRRRNSSSRSNVSGTTNPRRPTTGRPPPISFRSFSDGNRTGRDRSSSLMSIFDPHLQRTKSSDGTGVRPDVHAQGDFVEAHQSSSRVSLPRPRLQRAPNISTHQAIVHEVMAEEELALASRLEEEAAEAEKARATKSWITSWMFKKPE